MRLTRCTTCLMPDCDRPIRCKGMCSVHYSRSVAAREKKRTRDPLTLERLRSVLRYDRDTGLFTRISGSRADLVGKQVSTATDARGYPRVAVDGRRYYAHRLAWFYEYGYWPDGEVDHINGDRSDNRLINLRTASRRVNAQNMRAPRQDNSSGYLGVSFDSSRGKWVARINLKHTYKYLGRFDTAEDARDAYLAAKRKHHEGCTI